ncbi:MAG: hypothetical protein F9K40_15295 [Kofleriaceae bacterium]|nr:MAG: hypothetical protein F9K40_15295 [Kofleriaceae bacterium]MBZ0236297.1 TerB family tellurite resistance protein [Kofleriaceae bacterium]
MADSQFLTVIRIWAAMAWADGVLAEAEASALRRLISGAQLDEAEAEKARSFLESRTELGDDGLAEMSPDAKQGIYKAACRMAALDREVAQSERTMLVKLRDALGLSLDSAREIEAGVPGVTVS